MFKQSIKRVLSDNAPEFIALTLALEKLGIELTMSSSYTPESNELAERKNKFHMEKARSMIMYAGLPNKYWGEAIWQAAYIHNRVASSVKNVRSLHEILFGKAPGN